MNLQSKNRSVLFVGLLTVCFMTNAECKGTLRFQSMGNTENARGEGDTRGIKYLEEHETASEPACLSYSNKTGHVCKSFSWHDSVVLYCNKKYFSKQYYAVTVDSWGAATVIAFYLSLWILAACTSLERSASQPELRRESKELKGTRGQGPTGNSSAGAANEGNSVCSAAAPVAVLQCALPRGQGTVRSWERCQQMQMQPIQRGNKGVSRRPLVFLSFCLTCLMAIPVVGGHAVNGSIGVLVPLRWQTAEGPKEAWAIRKAAAAKLAVYHINNRVASLVPKAAELLPANFKLVMNLQDSMALPSVAVKHAVAWNEEGRHAIIGSFRSAVTGPLALAASIAATPVVAWGATASSLSDRDTYPTLSRTILSDAVLAESTINAIGSMGWTRIAILYVDDAWGRGYANDANVAAAALGVEVLVSAGHPMGDRTEIAKAISLVAESGARVTLCVSFQSDVAAIVETADSLGLMRTGYAWVLGTQFSVETVLSTAADRARMMEMLPGWLEVPVDQLEGERGPRFHEALYSAPLQYLDDAAFEGLLTEELLRNEPCDGQCATIYDAVWAAAIAISSMKVEKDESVDKVALLAAIRNTSFEGASGRVMFHENGERDARDQWVHLNNVQQVTAADGSVSLSMVPVWRWKGGFLERAGNTTPVWPGGEQKWELPYAELECESGLVFSRASLQCEPCPKGTVAEDAACVRYAASLGVLVPLRWGGPASAMPPFALRWAASAVLAFHHINNRVASLVPKAAELLPANFKLVMNLQDSMAQPSVAVKHAVAFNEEGRHAIIGSLRSAVTGPLALAASIAATPVISWASTASSLWDRATYPTLGRTILSDAMLAAATIQSIRAIGWKRVAILYVSDEWGRSLAQDFVAVASDVGVEIVTSADHRLGDLEGIASAVSTIADSGARVILSATYDSDLAHVAAAADGFGMVKAGYVWLVPSDMNFNDVVALSPDPEKTHQRLSGWLSASINPLYGVSGARYQEVFQNRSEVSLEDLNFGILKGFVSEELLDDCDQYCAALYDAMWTAAIAISSMEVAEDGSVDKVALLAAIRSTSFEGATGRVQFDQEGERDPVGIPLLLQNLRPPSGPAGKLELTPVVTWEWRTDGSGSGTLSRQGEEAPYWPGGEQTWEVPPDGAYCPAGFFFSRASFECEPCPPGTALLDGACQACPLGTFSSEWGAIACERCQVGYANATGMTTCLSCPPKTVRSAASPGINVTECLCVLGYYSQQGPGHACQPCITGAQCDGGNRAPYPVEGFWADQECEQFGFGNKSCPQWDSFVPCNPAGNCKGGPEFGCFAGRTGRLCLQTTEGWSNVGGIFFWECGQNGKLITVFGILGVIVVWAMLNAFAAGEFVALNIALMFVQVTAIIGSYGLKWHSYLHYVNIAMGVANFDVDFVSASCLLPWTPIASFYFQLTLPFVAGTLYIVYFLVVEFWHVWHDGQPTVHYKRMLRQTLKHLVSFVNINYTTLAVKCFQSLRCTSFPDGRSYMLFASQVECWTGSHWRMVCISVLYILGILVGLPFGIWYVISRHKKAGTLHSIKAELQWGFVHVAYEADYKWWECVLIFRRFSIAFIAVMIPEPMLQGAATLVVLVGLLSAQTFTAPFIRSDIDVLDFLAICGSMLYCLSGMLFYPSVTNQAQGRLCTESSDSAFCTQDQDVKRIVSVMAFITILSMVAVSVGLTLRSVFERRASALATKKIRHLQNLSRTASKSRASNSVNRVLLDEILEGRQLLNWSRHLSQSQQSVKYKSTALQFLEVEESLMALAVDMTPSSFDWRATVMRHLVDLPGFVDYLATTDEASVAATRQFVDNVASFLQASHENGTQFLSNELTRFEHRPLLCYWLAHTDEMQRQIFLMIVQAIHRANGHDDCGVSTRTGSGESRVREAVEGQVWNRADADSQIASEHLEFAEDDAQFRPTASAQQPELLSKSEERVHSEPGDVRLRLHTSNAQLPWDDGVGPADDAAGLPA